MALQLSDYQDIIDDLGDTPKKCWRPTGMKPHGCFPRAGWIPICAVLPG